ncbi:unnamed protein product [Pocillopora meandrina]|uniref:Uncharacterized protein n=1 Tax=Pocillopora meandrina TaxID=46732 RepID=A0AAU9Y5R9_9CNID|nr:unnamed protein product [Pocillopora meandrina]
MSLPSTGFNAASPSMATVVTNASSRQPTVTPAASSLSLPTNGRETRRYLTQMARNSIRADVYQLQIDDSDGVLLWEFSCQQQQQQPFCNYESQAVGDAEKEEGTKEEDQEEKQEKEKEEEKGGSNEEEKLENGDKGGNGGIPAGVVEKEHEEMKGEREIKEKEQGTKKRRRDRRTTAKRKKAKKDPST